MTSTLRHILTALAVSIGVIAASALPAAGTRFGNHCEPLLRDNSRHANPTR